MDSLLYSILSDWYMTQDLQNDDIADIDTNISSHNNRVKNIKTQKKVSKSKIQQLALPV
ncbi:11001_t:CDS:2 [Funneliformis caledonium]|uniref:11001_t:CDS:1 n=1 Tax=Funneliformis caledonium TaxID=1117310 RepID=A0A9N9HRS0_9GLOM|nr:11001_t:CDS:2 [Funneliformis caledonium]